MAKSFWDWFGKFDYLDADSVDMWNSSTYIHHKMNTIFRLPFAPTVCFIPWLGGIKNPLHNIFAHRQYWKEKNQSSLVSSIKMRGPQQLADLFLRVGKRNERNMIILRAVIFLVWKKECLGFLCAEKDLSIFLFTSSNLQLYD